MTSATLYIVLHLVPIALPTLQRKLFNTRNKVNGTIMPVQMPISSDTVISRQKLALCVYFVVYRIYDIIAQLGFVQVSVCQSITKSSQLVVTTFRGNFELRCRTKEKKRYIVHNHTNTQTTKPLPPAVPEQDQLLLLVQCESAS